MKILKKMKIFKIFRHSKEKWKIDPIIPPKWPQKWKIYQKKENFEKNENFEILRQSTKKIKNWHENSPSKDLKKWKVDLKNENFEKNGKF